ncbi:hypothetical protein MCEMSEM22_02324 [Comamonadaceae bacterium]
MEQNFNVTGKRVIQGFKAEVFVTAGPEQNYLSRSRTLMSATISAEKNHFAITVTTHSFINYYTKLTHIDWIT